MGGRKLQTVFRHWKILRGDRVRIMSGKEKGLQGTVLKVFRATNKVLIEGRNLATKHIPPQDGNPGQKATIEKPLHVSNVTLLHPATGEPCKVWWKKTLQPIEGAFEAEGKQKYKRIFDRVVAAGKESTEEVLVPRPAGIADRKKPRPTEAGPKDTPKEAVRMQTYDPRSNVGGLPSLDELLDKLNLRPHLRGGTVRHLVKEEERRERERQRQKLSQ